jgi:hypothetical protein
MLGQNPSREGSHVVSATDASGQAALLDGTAAGTLGALPEVDLGRILQEIRERVGMARLTEQETLHLVAAMIA